MTLSDGSPTLPISMLSWGKRRNRGELLTPSLRDRARGQSLNAHIAATGHFPFTRIRIEHNKCFVFFDNYQFDIDKMRATDRLGLIKSLSWRDI